MDDDAKSLEYIKNYVLRDTQLPKLQQAAWVDVLDRATECLKGKGLTDAEPQVRRISRPR